MNPARRNSWTVLTEIWNSDRLHPALNHRFFIPENIMASPVFVKNQNPHGRSRDVIISFIRYYVTYLKFKWMDGFQVYWYWDHVFDSNSYLLFYLFTLNYDFVEKIRSIRGSILKLFLNCCRTIIVMHVYVCVDVYFVCGSDSRI